MASVQRLIERMCPAAQLRIETHSSVLAAIAFLHGLKTEELHPGELDYFDPTYQLLITSRVVNPSQSHENRRS